MIFNRENGFHPPSLLRPLLPLAWHPRVQFFVKDIAAIAVLHNIDVDLKICEGKNGELVTDVGIDDDLNEDEHVLISAVCYRARESIALICVFSWHLTKCFGQRAIQGFKPVRAIQGHRNGNFFCLRLRCPRPTPSYSSRKRTRVAPQERRRDVQT